MIFIVRLSLFSGNICFNFSLLSFTLGFLESFGLFSLLFQFLLFFVGQHWLFDSKINDSFKVFSFLEVLIEVLTQDKFLYFFITISNIEGFFSLQSLEFP